MSARCSHLDSIQVTELPDGIPGFEDCLASGGWRVHCYVDDIAFVVRA